MEVNLFEIVDVLKAQLSSFRRSKKVSKFFLLVDVIEDNPKDLHFKTYFIDFIDLDP